MLWLIEYDSAHWAGASSHCVAKASTSEEAILFAEEHMFEEMLELYRDEYDEEAEDSQEAPMYENESTFSVISCEPFDEKHEYWGYYCDKQQNQFFPLVN